MDINILAIESSCDDTAAAVMKNGDILSNIIASQKVHEAFGGVIPELASRAHQENIVPVVHEALKEAGIEKEELSVVAFTKGPGLIGPLLVGSSFAKSFAIALEIPVIGVHHMAGHVLSHFIEEPRPEFPFLCLTVSGGHTQIVLVKDHLDMEVIGETTDDAAGEAFDKTAKILDLPYPGGPLIDKLAAKGDPDRFTFPEPKVPGLNFSFSGLKTSILNFIQKETAKDPDFIERNKADICASVQQRIVTILMNKLVKASEQTGISQVAVAGGVSANSGLRKAIEDTGKRLGWKTYIPAFEYCTDNAAMIAMVGHFKFLKNQFDSLDISPAARIAINNEK
ncbi:MAG: tRNA (adenosine(37)-N6)-threonylcarbamoyltransferase complex transferase subunit TsaD [Bacteroidetes bacterium]|nr:tRNA (adenosine(37)-N6)-threonylcarbamoyltransferase complex transferase subunit TsaD [Bacteroidota bacterium]